MLEVRYPNVQVRITEEYPWGYDGEDEEFYSVENPDAASILERVRSALREGGVGDEEIEAYTTEATSRCYNHMIFTTSSWVRIRPDVPCCTTGVVELPHTGGPRNVTSPRHQKIR